MTDNWEDNTEIEHNMNNYVAQNLRRHEVLDFVRRDYPQYSWSLSTLD